MTALYTAGMPDVNPEIRSYRQLQAGQTKEHITAAARRLFASHGYRGTSIEAIAKEAGVGVRTVYAVFGNKKQLLQEVRLAWVFAAQTPELMNEATTETDPRRRLALAARWIRRQFESGIDIIATYSSAAAVDHEMAQEYERVLAGRRAAIKKVLKGMPDALREDLSLDDAIAVYLAIGTPETYKELVDVGGWSPDRYEGWLATAMQSLLLRE
jgi:AcrR family transcriptional regulator